MADRSSRRPLIAAAVLVALAAGAALAVVLTSEGEQEPGAPPAGTGARTAETETETTQARARTTETAERPSADTPRARREARGIERTVIGLVESAEQNDGPRFCRLVGRPGSDAQACATVAGIDPTSLPTSDELSIERVDASRGRATVRLVGGTRILLRRPEGRWIVIGLQPAGAGQS